MQWVGGVSTLLLAVSLSGCATVQKGLAGPPPSFRALLTDAGPGWTRTRAALAGGVVRLARGTARAIAAGGRGLRRWTPIVAEGAVDGVLQIRRLRPRIERVASAPEGQDFAIGRTGVTVRRSVETFRDQRFRYVVPQQLDFSCGAAALATLFRFYYDDPVGEGEIITEMLVGGDADRIRREGFSLLDMKHFAEARGYETKGFRLEPGVLDRLAIPTVALVNTRGYAHFVVLKGARDGDVYLADPALGQRRVPVEEFEQEWGGVVLFVAKKRSPDAVAPLEVLALNRPSPVEVVRDFALLGIRPRIANPRAF
jgi:predicted double-glycine peptidase